LVFACGDGLNDSVERLGVGATLGFVDLLVSQTLVVFEKRQ
jgi:hypothetical protein